MAHLLFTQLINRALNSPPLRPHDMGAVGHPSAILVAKFNTPVLIIITLILYNVNIRLT